MKIASDFFESKTTILGIAAILTALGTAAGVYAKTGDWRTALGALFAALYSAFQVTKRDTVRRGDEEKVAALDRIALLTAAKEVPEVVVVRRDPGR